MKITIQEHAEHEEVEIVIHCRKADEQVSALVNALSRLGRKLIGAIEDRTYVLDPADMLYFESVDKKTFAYTQSAVYELPQRLYELEESLPRDFFRAAKALIINLSKVESIRPDFNGRLEVRLSTGERLIVSRQYAQHLKARLADYAQGWRK